MYGSYSNVGDEDDWLDHNYVSRQLDVLSKAIDVLIVP